MTDKPEIKERPILFKAGMVNAILDGRKTQTRRVVKYPSAQECGGWLPNAVGFIWSMLGGSARPVCPYGKIEDQLYIREEYYQKGHWEPVPGVRTKTGRMKWKFVPADDVLLFEAPPEFRKGRHHKDSDTVAWHKRLARFMPKAYSRIQLEITDIRVERLNDISEEDAKAEGISVLPLQDDADKSAWYQSAPGVHQSTTAKRSFCKLWRSINGNGSWDKNPWVWVVVFKRINSDKPV